MDIFAEIEIAEQPLQGQSQRVALPAPQAIGTTVDPIRQKFYDMRGMASDNPYTWSDGRLFYKQARFMENFTDDYAENVEFSMHYPCFQRMGYERLRTYFTWRTSARHGEFTDIGLSYVFLYVYELLLCIGNTDKNPAWALAGLLALRGAYAEKFPVLDNYLPAWLKDFHIYYELPHTFEEFVQKHGLHNFYGGMFIFDGENGLNAWNKISAYDVEKSKFYLSSHENAGLLEECFRAAINGLTTLCSDRNIRLKDLFVLTESQEITWSPFRQALFYPWLRQGDRRVELPGGEVFTCRNNEWTTKHAAPYAHKRDLAAFIIKKTEALTRERIGYKTKISADTATLIRANAALERVGVMPADIAKAIESAIMVYFYEKNRIVVNVDRKNLERIREEAEDITEKLIVEEDSEKNAQVESPQNYREPQNHNPQTIPAPSNNSTQLDSKQGDIFMQFAHSLSSVETEALSLILSEDQNTATNKIKAFADGKGLMLEILVDNINEKAMETIGDNILELTDTLIVYDEYKNALQAGL